jgi:hypothetical protein
MEDSMADSNRNPLKGDHTGQQRNRQPKVDGAHGDAESVEGTSADEARKQAEGTYGKTGKHDS